MHRPIFGVKVTEKNSMYRITKIAKKVLEDTTFNTNFYDFGVQLNRFFGLTVLPGSCYCGTLDRFNSIKGILLDMRGMKVDRCIDLPMFGCGDSRLAARNDEQCDDGNLVTGDGCSKDCKVEAWWQCSQIEGERSICTPKLCGNGLVDTGEECDDGNAVNGDGCTSACIEERGYQCVSGRTPHCKWMCGDNLVY
jgi:cysteine-rich repeat protein